MRHSQSEILNIQDSRKNTGIQMTYVRTIQNIHRFGDYLIKLFVKVKAYKKPKLRQNIIKHKTIHF